GVNPLGLTQVDECSNVNETLLGEVKDEIDVAARAKVPEAELRSRRAKAVAAVYHLLCVAATKPPERLAAESRKDVFFSNFWKEPNAYRGKLVRIKGILRQVTIEREDASLRNPYGIATVYQASIITEDEQAPILVLFTQLPPSVKPSLGLKENVTV